jgi:hypothetical protein
MFGSTIVYFSLLSASWMSTVSAVLDGPQTVIINEFHDRLRGGQHLDDAVYYTQEEALDAYCEWKIKILNNYVNSYISRMDPNTNHGRQHRPPRGQDSDLAWNEIPYLVYWVRYSNLRILNGLKNDMIRRGYFISPQSILAVITDGYLRDVSVQYGENNQPPTNSDSFEALILSIAVQFSMNQAMLVRIQSPNPLLTRLQRYQSMISDLHDGMARYLQIETRISYHNKFMPFANRIAGLRRRRVRGYDHSDVTFCVDSLSRELLSVIAIYAGGALAPKGKEVISRLLETKDVVRHYMRLDRHRDILLVAISDRLLDVLGLELGSISNIYQPGYAWMTQVMTMLDQLRDVGLGIN